MKMRKSLLPVSAALLAWLSSFPAFADAGKVVIGDIDGYSPDSFYRFIAMALDIVRAGRASLAAEAGRCESRPLRARPRLPPQL
jgi:hypothetical protein